MEEFFYGQGGETLQRAAERSSVCPVIESVQGQLGESFEQPDLVKDVPACGRELDQLILNPSQTLICFMIIWLCTYLQGDTMMKSDHSWGPGVVMPAGLGEGWAYRERWFWKNLPRSFQRIGDAFSLLRGRPGKADPGREDFYLCQGSQKHRKCTKCSNIGRTCICTHTFMFLNTPFWLQV